MAKLVTDVERRVEILTPVFVIQELYKLIEVAGRACYQSLKSEVTLESAVRFVRMLLGKGHTSLLEHCVLMVRLTGWSRGLTHEFVRHRAGIVYSQESTRYVNESDLHAVLPPHQDWDYLLELDDGSVASPKEMMDQAERNYRALLKAGWPKEDARQVLPIGTCSQIVATANLVEWRYILGLRLGKAAHWEIRTAMAMFLEQVRPLVPVVFDDFVQVEVDKNGVPFFERDPSVFAAKEA